MSKHNRVIIDGMVEYWDIVNVARRGYQVEFSRNYIERVNKSNVLLQKCVDENRLIYGVTTGFGKNLTKVIPPRQSEQLQINIVRSHATAVGEPLCTEQTRAIQFMLLVNLGQGYSGIRLSVLELIKDMLNNRITPFARGDGSVGYLAVEAFLALTLLGEGRCYLNNQLIDSSQALNQCGLKPLTLKAKEGLSMLNGSMSVSALAALALYDSINAAKAVERAALLSHEALQSQIAAFDPRLHRLKKHPLQRQLAVKYRAVLADSEIMAAAAGRKVQDNYTLRCTAHIHAAALQTLNNAKESINNEINSVSDNPVLLADKDGVAALMGGNFDAGFVTMASDSALLALLNMARLADRRVDYLMSRDQPAADFLSSRSGLNSGFMLWQYSVAGLFSEMVALGSPMSLQSITTCAGQEEPVSLAYHSSRKLQKTADKLYYIAAIETMLAAKGILMLQPLKPSPSNQKIVEKITKIINFSDEDRFYSDELENLRILLKEEKF